MVADEAPQIHLFFRHRAIYLHNRALNNISAKKPHISTQQPPESVTAME